MERYNEKECKPKRQTHVHEILSSVKIDKSVVAHNHRFAVVSDQVIPVKCGHIHKVYARTDNYEGHYHEICVKTGLAIPVCEGRHVHFLKGVTSCDADHNHKFIAATLIENPIGK